MKTMGYAFCAILTVRIKGRFTAVKGDGAAWAHPVIHRGRLCLRYGNLPACYDLRALE